MARKIDRLLQNRKHKINLNATKNIVITGNRFGLGPAIANQLLNQGITDIAIIDHPNRPIDQSNISSHIKIVSGELADLPFLMDIINPETIIYHIDLILSLNEDYLNHLREHNITGTTNLINLALKNNALLIYVGSMWSQDAKLCDQIEPIDILQQANLEIHRGIEEGLTINPYYLNIILDNNSRYAKNMPSKKLAELSALSPDHLATQIIQQTPPITLPNIKFENSPEFWSLIETPFNSPPITTENVIIKWATKLFNGNQSKVWRKKMLFLNEIQ